MRTTRSPGSRGATRRFSWPESTNGQSSSASATQHVIVRASPFPRPTATDHLAHPSDSRLTHMASIGCHVMERESFENDAVAAILNESFIPIKIDREERPDVDRIYMNYVQASTGSGGWPLNVFLTPNLEPVFGGTYWPGPNAPTLLSQRGQPSFMGILRRFASIWQREPDRCRRGAEEIVASLRRLTVDVDARDESSLSLELLGRAFDHFATRFDKVNGGFGSTPTPFPQPTDGHVERQRGQLTSTMQRRPNFRPRSTCPFCSVLAPLPRRWRM